MIGFYINWAASTWFGLLHAHKYNRSWDAALNRLLDNKYQDARLCDTGRTLMIGGIEVWVENRFYAFGYLYSEPSERHFRPSLKTMARLWSFVAPMLAEQERKKNDFSGL